MPNRATRRAAERQAAATSPQQPAAEKAFAAGATFALPPDNTPPISEAKLNANRENAQKSTGPTSAAGRAKSCLNAIKTGLTARTVLLPSEDAALYQQHLDRFFKQFHPTNDEELALVQTIAETEWRLLRIMPLESAIWAVARIKLADLHADVEDQDLRQALIEGEIQLAYRKDLNNLATQERRLIHRSEAAASKLKELREAPKKKRTNNIHHGQTLYKAARERNLPFDPAAFGFDFTIDDLQRYINQTQAEQFVQGRPSDFTKDQYIAFVNQEKEHQAA